MIGAAVLAVSVATRNFAPLRLAVTNSINRLSLGIFALRIGRASNSGPAKGKPLHNRTGAPDPSPRQGEEIALKLRNRAQEIVRRDGCGYLIAFRRAEAEYSTPKGE